MSAIQFNAQQASLLAAIDASLDNLCADGGQYPSGTTILPGIQDFTTLPNNYRVLTRQTLEQILGATMATPQLWTTATLVNNWTNFGSNYTLAAYSQDALGRVWLRGSIVAGLSSAGNTAFTLPMGLAPPTIMIFSLGSIFVTVNPDGTVVPTGSVSLAGISFTLT